MQTYRYPICSVCIVLQIGVVLSLYTCLSLILVYLFTRSIMLLHGWDLRGLPTLRVDAYIACRLHTVVV